MCTELVWKVARYTSAAPMNFSECDNYVDGGVLANNPSEYGLTAIQNFHRENHLKLSIACVVSLGTGIFPAEDLGSTNAHEGVFDLLSLKKKATNLKTLISKAVSTYNILLQKMVIFSWLSLKMLLQIAGVVVRSNTFHFFASVHALIL